MLVADTVIDGLERYEHWALHYPDKQSTYPKLTGLVSNLRALLSKLRGMLHSLRLGDLGEYDVSDVEDTIRLSGSEELLSRFQ